MSELSIDDRHLDDKERPVKLAIKNGMRLKCPKCGKGKLLHSYLKVNDECSNCGLDLSHQKADDGPAYLTILIVGHLVGFGMHIAWVTWRADPLVMAIGMSILAVATSLALLPVMKGLIIGYQWAKRMHGF